MSIAFRPNPSNLFQWEVNPQFTREEVTLLKGENLKLGAILGKVTATGKYVEINLAGADGSETVAGVLTEDMDATDEDKAVIIIARGSALIGEAGIVYPDGATDPNKVTIKNGLANIGIIVRESI